MKKIKVFSMMAAVLIAAMSIGFTSCSKDNKEPEVTISSGPIMGNWYMYGRDMDGARGILASLTFNINGTYSYNIEGDRTYSLNEDGTYSYVPENERNINGIYRITESEKTTISFTYTDFTYPEGIPYEKTDTYNATLHKMLVSGSSVFDQLWVYYYNPPDSFSMLAVHLYFNNELVQKLWGFDKISSI